MRHLLRKDLRILRRSPLLVALLIAYPIGVSLLLGLALSRGPDKPRVAIANELAASGDPTFSLNGQDVDPTSYAKRLFEVVEPVEVDTRAEALELVRSGDVLGALVVPADVADKLQGALALGGGEPPTLEVISSSADPLQAQIVDGLVSSRLAQANGVLSKEIVKVAAQYLGILLEGGAFSLLGQDFDVLGLQRTVAVVEGALADLPRGSPARAELLRVQRFAQLAVDNLDLSDEVLGAIGEPIRVKRTRIGGAAPALEDFAIAAAATVSLAFMTVLLGAGLLALEREEHALGRLVRGLVTPTTLVVAKAVLAAGCGVVATALMLGVLTPFVGLDAGRAPLWLAALGAGGLAFGALGVALGALAREVRAASLLAILLVLPVAFLALVPDGAVGGVVALAVDAVSFVFPFDPALRALDRAVNGGDGLILALVHALALVPAWLLVARVALRRTV